jgi:hypothetical protein
MLPIQKLRIQNFTNYQDINRYFKTTASFPRKLSNKFLTIYFINSLLFAIGLKITERRPVDADNFSKNVLDLSDQSNTHTQNTYL